MELYLLKSVFACIGLLLQFSQISYSLQVEVIPKISTLHRHWPLQKWTNLTRSDTIEVQSESPFVLRIRGSGFSSDTTLAFTTVPGKRGSACDTSYLLTPTFRLGSAETLTAELVDLKIKLNALPNGLLDTAYVCIGHKKGEREWVHQGDKVKIKVTAQATLPRFNQISITGLRAEGDRVHLFSTGLSNIPADQPTVLRLTGVNFAPGMLVSMTTSPRQRGHNCDDLPKIAVKTIAAKNILSTTVALIEANLPEVEEGEFYYLCVKEPSRDDLKVRQWVHQGDEEWLSVRAEGRIIPVWLQIWLIVFLQVMSGLFSGLNLGLMALDNTELQIIAKCGTATEKEFSKIISPLRKRGNYLLCTIVLGNVLVNSILTVLLDDLTSGLVAIIGSTVGIVIFGEIIPQAICSRHALAVGARTAWITKMFMVLTFPMSYPISRILDCVLGEEIANVYDRERLMEYIQLTKDYNKLEKEEVKIISGALELKTKTAADIMTRIEDVFMIPFDTILDFENITEIVRKGFTRVPVFDGCRDNIVALLHTKDLALVDPDDNTPLKTVCAFYNHPIAFVFGDETLDVLLNEFKKGRSHMSCIRQVVEDGEKDPSYQILGVVTLEDVIEEIIQSEIMDETDVLTDNRRKQRRKEVQTFQNYSDFVRIGGGHGKNLVSAQLALAAYQYLSTSVEPFKRPFVSDIVLRRLLSQNIFFMLKYRTNDVNENASPIVTIYKTGKQADYFVLILEGRVKVTVGKERLVYEAGPFTYFGVQAIATNLNGGSSAESQLQLPPVSVRTSSPSINSLNLEHLAVFPFVPDYTVAAISDLLYMKVPRAIYGNALKATMMERQHRSDASIDECFGIGSVSKPRTSSTAELKQSPEIKNEKYTDTLAILSDLNRSVEMSDVCTKDYTIMNGCASSPKSE